MEQPFPAYRGDDPYVFVCYAHDDAAIVYPEIASLHEQGIKFWYDEGISAGRIWRAEIADAIDGAVRILFYISSASLASDHCRREIHYALDKGLDVVPVYLDDVALPSDLEMGLSLVQALHRTGDANYAEHLLAALGRSAAPAPAPAPTRTRTPTMHRRRAVPIAIAVAILVAVGGWFWTQDRADGGRDGTMPAIPSIAVLPFEDLTREASEEYFVDGMTEVLTAELAKIKALKVISRTSAMRFKDTELAMPKIADELNVVGLIEGSVLREGDEIRVTVQLIHGPSDTHLWGESYTNTVTSVLKLQADLALAIAAEIGAAITPEEASRIASAKPVNPEAYREWLVGRHYREMLSEDGFKNAVEHLERAVALDPEFASAHAALAMAYWEPTTYGWADPAARVEPTRQAIDEALALDPDNSVAHAAAGHLAFSHYYDWAKAERELRRALELNSDNAYAYKYLVWSLATANRYDEAIAVGKTAVELDPLNAYALDALADAYSMAGQFDRSIPLRLQIQELAPDQQGNMLDLGLDYLAAGQPEDSLRVRKRLIELRGQDAPESLAVVYAYLGQRDKAHALLAGVEGDAPPAAAVIGMATAYALLGDTERAIDWLEYAYEHRAMVMVLLNVDWWRPFFESLEGHPRYEALREKMAFPG